MARYLNLAFLLLVMAITSCAHKQKATDSDIEFEKVVYKYEKPASDPSDEPSTVSFEIDWTKTGNEEIVKTLQTWILSNISPIALVQKEGQPLKSLLKEASPEILDNLDYEDFARTVITVTAEQNVPFDGYITLHVYKSTATALGMGDEDSYSDITIRLSDNKQFNYNTAIEDRELFRQMIINSIDWWDNDIMYSQLSDIPYPTFPIGLTKDGMEVRYDSSLGRGNLGFKVTIPYKEALMAFSEEAKSFLPKEIVELTNAYEQTYQDSIAKIEKFTNSLPEFEQLFKNTMLDGDIKNVNLEKLGFEKKEKKVKQEFEGESWEDTEFEYILSVDDSHYCKIKQTPGYECIWTSFIIKGYPDIFDQYKAKVKDFKNSGRYRNYGVGEPTIEISEDEIEWCDGV